MNLHIVHCNQLRQQDGELDQEIMARIRSVASIHKSGDLIILSGGVTRPRYEAESVVAREWAIDNGYMRIEDVLVEDCARSTGENIMLTGSLAARTGYEFDEVYVYHRASALPKTRVLYAKLWLVAGRLRFISGDDQSSLFYRTLDRTLFVILAYIDPREEGSFWRFLKKKFRNG